MMGLPHEFHLATLIAADAAGSLPPARQPRPLWTFERECIVDPVRVGSSETIAQAIHERWRSEQIGAGKAAPSWGELDESRKKSSRDQARDIPVKLRMVGCDIAPLREGVAKDFTFTDEEVETLAEAEHVRWMRERIADGWTAGDKDVTPRTTPYLVAFEELPADIAEFDRIFVREIPGLLASVGLQVVRAPTAPNSTGGDQPD
jgi:hypothetical protein